MAANRRSVLVNNPQYHTAMKTKFVKTTDRKGTYIIEGSSDGRFFNIKRFICQVQKQETEKETQELADFILSKLNS